MSSVALLAYADDSVLVDKSHDNLRSPFGWLDKVARMVGLRVNKDKIE